MDRSTLASNSSFPKPKPPFEVNALTSFEALVTNGDKKKETLLRRSNANIDKILSDVIREMLQQKLASLHYESINTRWLFVPTMAITLLSAVISIFGTSQLVETEQKKIWFSISVAVLQLVLSVLQSLSKQLNYGARAGFHRSASSTLKKLYQTAKHQRSEARYKSMHKALETNGDVDIFADPFGNDGDDSCTSSDESKSDDAEEKKSEGEDGSRRSEHDEPQKDEQQKQQNQKGSNATDSLTKQFKQAIDQVDSFVPIKISNAFNVMESRVRVINESLLTSKGNSLVAWEQVLTALYFQLAETIIDSRGFPSWIPGPKESVEKTLKKFKAAIDVSVPNNADLLTDILNRSNNISQIQNRIAQKRASERINRRMSSMMRSFAKDDVDGNPRGYGSIV